LLFLLEQAQLLLAQVAVQVQTVETRALLTLVEHSLQLVVVLVRLLELVLLVVVAVEPLAELVDSAMLVATGWWIRLWWRRCNRQQH
jgi:hypothetical protein